MIKKRRASLTATLILCIIIITISVYVMKWVLDRYMTVTRFRRSSEAKIRTEGVMLRCCQGGSGCPSAPDGKSITVSGINCGASNATQFTLNIDADL